MGWECPGHGAEVDRELATGAGGDVVADPLGAEAVVLGEGTDVDGGGEGEEGRHGEKGELHGCGWVLGGLVGIGEMFGLCCCCGIGT